MGNSIALRIPARALSKVLRPATASGVVTSAFSSTENQSAAISARDDRQAATAPRAKYKAVTTTSEVKP